MWIGAEASCNHAQTVTTVTVSVKRILRYDFCVPTESQIQTVCKRVAVLLQKERERQGLSLTTLGAQAGLSQQSISYIERGLRIPNLDTMLRISGALGIELSEVLATAAKSAKRTRI